MWVVVWLCLCGVGLGWCVWLGSLSYDCGCNSVDVVVLLLVVLFVWC